MRDYLSHHPEQRGSFSPEDLDVLDLLMRRVTEALHIVEDAERDEVAAKILSLYSMRRSPEDILDLTIRQFRHAPGHRPAPARAEAQHQRRTLERKKD